jgi:hypothetical protein
MKQQVTVWDLSVEADDGDVVGGPNKDAQGLEDMKLPPQLLFVHQGQHDVKELHFHPQVLFETQITISNSCIICYMQLCHVRIGSSDCVLP